MKNYLSKIYISKDGELICRDCKEYKVILGCTEFNTNIYFYF